MATKRKPAGKARTQSVPARVRAGRTKLSTMEQLQADVLGLGLLAAAVFLSLVFYEGWAGGAVGEGLFEGGRMLVGLAAYLLPIVIGVAGALLIARPLIAGAPRIAGLGALGAGLMLALAARTAGIGPSEPVRSGYFDVDFASDHGGMVGELLYWASVTLFQTAGAHILASLLVVAGTVLVLGRPIASALEGAGDRARGVSGMWSRAEDRTRVIAGAVRGKAPAPPRGPAADVGTDGFGTVDPDEDWGPPEPEGEEPTIAVSAPEPDLDPIDLGPDPEPEPEIEVEDLSGPETSEQPSLLEADGATTAPRTPMGAVRGGVTESDEINYRLPSPRALERSERGEGPDRKTQEETGRILLEALGHHGVEARLSAVVSGPSVSQYELELKPGTKVGKVSNLKDDLAYALAATEIRIIAPIPGKRAVGVEVPNLHRRMVRLGDIYKGRPKGASPLACWLGKDINGHGVWTDLAKMPHVLVAGTTGSGKSGCVNAILSSLLLHATPNELRLVLVDPKRVELNHYEKVPHLLTPVVTNPRVASNVLSNLLVEMENRYQVMGEARARNLPELNRARAKSGEAPLPYILCVIDELADLMMVAPAEVEDAIIRLAQKSRAVGIHLLLATQRPSTDIITGTIKVNIPARIAFAVSSQVDSRVILDAGGAESLLGQGDMLFRPVGSSKLQRVQGAFVTEDEIDGVMSQWARQGEPDFQEELLQAPEPPEDEGGDDDLDADQDDLLNDAIRLVIETQTASVSMVQRRLRVGYTRAGRLIDMLERRGVISGYEGSKPRQVLVGAADMARVLAAQSAGAAGPAEAGGEDGDATPAPEPSLSGGTDDN
ncbi:MAG: DNA translocase FtsK [Solirubrobacterales bacterium]